MLFLFISHICLLLTSNIPSPFSFSAATQAQTAVWEHPYPLPPQRKELSSSPLTFTSVIYNSGLSHSRESNRTPEVLVEKVNLGKLNFCRGDSRPNSFLLHVHLTSGRLGSMCSLLQLLGELSQLSYNSITIRHAVKCKDACVCHLSIRLTRTEGTVSYGSCEEMRR